MSEVNYVRAAIKPALLGCIAFWIFGFAAIWSI